MHLIIAEFALFATTAFQLDYTIRCALIVLYIKKGGGLLPLQICISEPRHAKVTDIIIASDHVINTLRPHGHWSGSRQFIKVDLLCSPLPTPSR